MYSAVLMEYCQGRYMKSSFRQPMHHRASGHTRLSQVEDQFLEMHKVTHAMCASVRMA